MLEALEPRLLLSAADVLPVSSLETTPTSIAAPDAGFLDAGEDAGAWAQPDATFGGAVQEGVGVDLFAGLATEVLSVEAPAATDDGAGGARGEADVDASRFTALNEVVLTTTATVELDLAADAFSTQNATEPGGMATLLTETLRSANGPPLSQAAIESLAVVAESSVTARRAAVALSSVPSGAGDEVRLEATGQLGGDPDEYSFDLSAGDYATLVLSVSGGDAPYPFTWQASTLTPTALATGDLDRDGFMDLVLVGSVGEPANDTGGLAVWFGQANGSFTAVGTGTLDGVPADVALADLDGDLDLDIVTANRVWDAEGSSVAGTVVVLLNDGTGHFGAPAYSAVSGSPQALAVGDMNQDSKLDVVVANDEPNQVVSVLCGDGAGGLGARIDSANQGISPSDLALGDLDGDGKLDVVLGDGSGYVTVWKGQGEGVLSPPVQWVQVGAGMEGIGLAAVGVAEVTGDGKLDVVTANGSQDQTTGNTVAILQGMGDGTLALPRYLKVANGSPQALALVDFDGDGDRDILTANRSDGVFGGRNVVSWLANLGSGRFELRAEYDSCAGAVGLAVGAMGAGSALDFVVAGAAFDADGMPVDGFAVHLDWPPAVLELLNSSRNVLAQGSDEGTGAINEFITGFVAATAGPHIARVSGGVPGRDYSLVITRRADVELPPSQYLGGPQDITRSGQVLGSMAGSFDLDTFVLLSEGFESGTLPDGWQLLTSGANGRVLITDAYGAASGASAIAMDREVIGFNWAREDAIWTVDLSAIPDALLRFSHASYGYNEFGGVLVSSQDGTQQTLAWAAPNQASGVWQTHTVDLASAAAAAGFTLGTDTQIQLESYGYEALPVQGRLWDDVQILAWGDEYAVNVNAGDSFTLTLARREGGPGEPENTLEARIDVLDPTGVLIASDVDLDGLLNVSAAASGKYVIRLRHLNGAGDYVLRVEGATGTAEPFQVVAAEPAEGGLVAGFPAVYRVHVSSELVLSTVAPGDLLLNGVAASGVRSVDGNTLEFDIAGLNAGNGTYTVSLAAGALTSVSGTPLSAFVATFTADVAGPKVTAVAPLAAGGSVVPGDLTVTFQFDEPLATGWLDAADVRLFGDLAGVLAPTAFSYDAVSRTLTLGFSDLHEGHYSLTLTSSAEGLRDIAGNPLDGNGDGVVGDDFVLAFNVDYAEPRVLTTPLVQLVPSGGGFYTLPGVVNGMALVSGVFHGAGDHDLFTLRLDPGQSVTVTLTPPWEDFQLVPQIGLLDPQGNLVGSVTGTAGVTTILQSAPANLGGVYTVDVSSVAGGGEYYLGLLLNADLEIENDDGAANDSRANAQALVAQGAGARFAVWGSTLQGEEDWYRISLAAGDVISVAVGCATAGRHVDVTLTEASGAALALGVEDVASNTDEYLSDFLVPATGDYYVQLVGESATAYGLLILRGQTFEREPNASASGAQQLQTGTSVAGWLDAPGYSLEPDDYVSGTVLTDIIPGVTLTVQGLAGTVTSLSSTRRSTGSRSFGMGSGAEDFLWASTYQWLRVEFANPVDMVSIDAIAKDSFSRTWAVLQAYDAQGKQLAVVDTNGGAGQNSVRTLAVSRARPEIKYFIASGLGLYSAGLDNLVVGSDKVDTYVVQAEAGKALQLWTTTPGDGAGEPLNDLDPRLDVYDANHNLVASNEGSAADLRNAWLEFTAGAGLYTVQVTGKGRGQYELHWAGASLVNPAPAVIAAVPVEASNNAHAPAVIDLVFSEPVRADVLNAAALTVEGYGPATAAVLVDGRTVRYTVGLNATDLEGPYTYTLAASGCVDLQGVPSVAYTGTFFVDRTGPSVVSYSPSPSITLPLSVITLTFSEPIKASSVSTADVVTFTGPGGVNLKSRVSRLEVVGAEVRVLLSPIQTAEGTYTLVLGPAIEDYVGNKMDQDHDGTYGETTADRYTAVIDLAPPNLVPQSVIITPSPANFGQTVDVSWTSQNAGRGPANGAWSVWIWLSTDPAISPTTDYVLKSMVSPTPDPLPALSELPQTVSVTLPIGPAFIEGTYYILVQVDTDNAVFETAETDNTASVALSLTLPHLPDLQVAGEVTPVVTYPGGTVSLRWTVTNAGTGPAEQDWHDAVYLSPDATFDEATDLWLHTYDAKDQSPLGVAAVYSVTQTLTIPNTTAVGAHVLIIVTDRYAEQMETDNENNTTAVTLDIRAPDLVVDRVEAALAAFFGSTLPVSWTVRNAGTYAAVNGWSDGFWLSQDSEFSSDDRLLATIASTAPLPVEAGGASYRQSGTVVLPLTTELAAGTYYLLAKADALGAVVELEEGNNFGAVAIQLTVPPLPDLTIPEVVVPAEAYSQTDIPVTWTVVNQGTAAAKGSWIDRVLVATNPAGTDGVLLGEFPFEGTIDAGKEVTRNKTVSLPYDLEGARWVVVVTDETNTIYEHAAEGNNLEAAAITVHLSPFPNLQVSSITQPDAPYNGQTILVEWVVTNVGTGSTTVPAWTDEVWLSEDKVFDPRTDMLLGRVDNPSYLDASGQYVSRLEATLPIDQWGQRYLLVLADTWTKRPSGSSEYVNFDQVLEPGHEDDNLRASEPMDIQLSPPPDLQVTSVIVPPTLFYGQDLTVEFTVTNLGLGATRGTEDWWDFVFLSQDEVITWGGHSDPGDDICLGRYDHEVGGVAPGESYSVSITFPIDSDRATAWYPLPAEISGDYYVVVYANWTGPNSRPLFEDGFSGNNWGHPSFRTRFLAEPEPDLQALAVDMPTTGVAGHEIMLSWSGRNNGPGATEMMTRIDAFFLSTDQVWDATDIKMGVFGAVYPVIEPGGGFNAPGFPLPLPVDVEGDYYVIYATDYTDHVAEAVETNNRVTSSHTIHIESRPPDLVTGLLSTYSEVAAGQMILVQWKVTNQGIGDTVAPVWNDGIYLGERQIASVRHGSWGAAPLGVGGTYTASARVEIPVDLEGAFGLYVKADAVDEGDGQVYEGAREDNNASLAAALNIVKKPADLRVTGIRVGGALVAGEMVPVKWTVENFGPGYTDAESWYDQLVLSSDSLFDENDVILERVIPNSTMRYPMVGHSNRLEADGTYSTEVAVLVPADLAPGAYNLIIRTDRTNRVHEGEETNNDLALATQVTAVPATFADLVVESIATPGTAWSGSSVEVGWRVHNQGVATTERWSDYVYLSTDQVFDPNDDVFLGRVVHSWGLDAGGSYSETGLYALPRAMAGPLYVFVATDRPDTLNEGEGEDNNVGCSTAPILVSLAPRVDLTVTDVTVPASGTLGETITVSYTVGNQSGSPTLTSWYDGIYLSADDTWGLDDARIARVERSDLAAGASATWNVTASLPGVVPGQYRVLVHTDVRNQLRESNEDNNVGVSPDRVLVDASLLALGTPAAGSLGNDQSVYYRIDVPEGGTLFVTFDSEAITASTELYLRFGQVPSRAAYDFRYGAAFAPDQQITVALTQAGSYYLLAYGDSAPVPAANYTVNARLLTFEVLDTDFGTGGTAGNLTLQINGAKFDRTVAAWLSSAGGFSLAASSMWYVNAARLYATFDLTQVQPGLYDVVIENAAGGRAVVPSALRVVSGGGPDLQMQFATPQVVLENREYSFSVTWENRGLNDALAPLAAIGTSGCRFGPAPGGPYTEPGMTLLGTSSDDGPVGILRPGDTETLWMFVLAGYMGSVDWYDLTLVYPDLGVLFDWGGLRETMLALVAPEGLSGTCGSCSSGGSSEGDAGMTEAEFDLVFARMAAQVGPTAGDYLRMLSRNATLLPVELGSPRELNPLLLLEFRRAQAAISTSLTGRAFSPDLAVDLSGRMVLAHNRTTGNWYATVSLNDGSFIFEGLGAGTYDLSLEGAIVVGGFTVTVPEGQARTGVVLSVERGGAIQGIVRNAATGLVLAGVRVTAMTATGEVSAEVTTNAAGEYELAPLTAGTYSLLAEAEGKARANLTGLVVAEGPVSQDITLIPAGSLTGSVQSGAGEPVGVPVFAIATLKTGDQAGETFLAQTFDQRFVFDGLPAGLYDVRFQADGYAQAKRTDVAINVGVSLDLGTIVLTATASLSGWVNLHAQGIDYSDVKAYAFAGDQAVQVVAVEDDGRFQFWSLTAGLYTLEAEAGSGTISSEVSVTLAAGDSLAGVVLDVWAGGTITGAVTDASMGSGASGVNVLVYGSAGLVNTCLTDVSGQYRFTGLDAGTYVITLPGGGAIGSTTVDVVDLTGLAVVANLAFAPVASLRGHLLTATGAPIAGGIVTLYEDGSPIISAQTGEDGLYVFELLHTGTFDLRATASGCSIAPQTGLDVAAGADVTVELAAGTGTITASVAGSEGAPAGTTVWLWQRTGSERVLLEQKDLTGSSTVSFTCIAAGQYTVEIQAPGNEGAVVPVAVVGAETHTLSLVLAAQGALSGQVVNSSGVAVGNALVLLISQADAAVILNAQTGDDGRYEMTHVVPGTYDLVVLAEGYRAWIQADLAVVTALARDVALELSDTEITGRLVDGSGLPVVGGQVTVLDEGGRMVGRAVSGVDGLFRITTAWGSALAVGVRAAGFGLAKVDGMNAPAGASVAMGTLGLTPFALSQSAPSTVSLAASAQTPSGLGSRSEIGLHGGGGGGDLGPSFLRIIFEKLILWHSKLPDHVETGDVPTPSADCIEQCGNAWLGATESVQLETTKWELADEWNEIVEDYALIAVGQWAAEALTTAATIGTAITLGLQIAAWAGVASAAAYTGAAATATLTQISVILGAVNSVVGLLMAGLQAYWDSLVTEEPDESGAILTVGQSYINWSGGLGGAYTAVVDAVRKLKGMADINWVHFGEISGVLGLVANWKSILDHLTYQDLIGTCMDMAYTWNQCKFERQRYEQSVPVANYWLQNLKDCLDKCEKNEPWEGDKYPTTPVHSKDPNDLLGPLGFGEEHWVSAGQNLAYTIRFENDPTLATAPARVVRITQQLDPDLDPASFRLGDFGFGTILIDVPQNTAYYSTRLDLTAEMGILLYVTAGLDVSTGEAFWEFYSIDPKTGETPDSPYTGFLPPNVQSPEGQGWVTYTIRTRSDAQTGDVIEAEASIVFDDNEPIDTPVYYNAIDAGAPSSQVAPLPAVVAAPEFIVAWAGTDDEAGSALSGYVVYVSEDGGPFTVWLADTLLTQAPFLGTAGHRYAFYSVALDNAGNREPIPVAPDTATLVAGGVATIGDRVWIDANHNGVQDDGERGFSGVRVELYTQSGVLVGAATTDGQGWYQFDELDPAPTYAVKFVAPSGWQFAPANQGSDDARDSDADPATGQTAAFTVFAGAHAQWDAGLYAPAKLRGLVWNDANGNGQRDASEAVLAGWWVYLDQNSNGTQDAAETAQQTDATGQYQFTDLSPGLYLVREVIPSGWKQTYPGSAGKPPAEANAHSVTVGAGEIRENLDFGNQRLNVVPAVPVARGISTIPGDVAKVVPAPPVARGVQVAETSAKSVAVASAAVATPTVRALSWRFVEEVVETQSGWESGSWAQGNGSVRQAAEAARGLESEEGALPARFVRLKTGWALVTTAMRSDPTMRML